MPLRVRFRCFQAGPARRRAAAMRAVLWAVAGAGVVLAVAFGGAAGAHADLARSDPADGSTLSAPPAAVRAWFTEAVDTGTLAVEDAAGREVARGGERLEKDGLSLALPPLAPGAYTVKWRLLSVDGHPVAGTFGFTVAAAAAPGTPAAAPEAPAEPAAPPPAEPAAAPAPSGAAPGANPAASRGAPVAALAVILAVVAAAAVWRRGRRG